MKRRTSGVQRSFTLKHVPDSVAERNFLEAADVLAEIPGVQHFRKLRQTSAKSDFAFGFSMAFSDLDAYEHYNDHPWHVSFVNEHWTPEVLRFMEFDYVPL